MLRDRHISFSVCGHYRESRIDYIDYDDRPSCEKWYDFIIIVSPKEQNLNVWDKIKYEQNFNDLKDTLLNYLITDN